MTEYDFSPEAYERYMATQQRIAQWVDQTEAHRQQFGAGRESRKPSSSQRFHRQRDRHRQNASSSSSSSSSVQYSTLPHAPGPMPLPPQNSFPHMAQSQERPSHSRHHSPHQQSSSHRAPVYPSARPAQAYPYRRTPGSRPTFPGAYAPFPQAGMNSATPHTGYIPQNTSYMAPRNYGQRPGLHYPPQAAPPAVYQLSSSRPSHPLNSRPAQYPQRTVFPPTIYAPMPYYPAHQQQLPQRPVLYRRIFERK